jgi:hypothetical protein
MHYSVNESTLIEKISWVLTYGLLLSKEVEMGYSEDSKDDGSSTQDKSPHLSINASTFRF